MSSSSQCLEYVYNKILFTFIIFSKKIGTFNMYICMKTRSLRLPILINVYVEFDMDEPPQPHDVMQSGGQMNAVFSSQISKYGPRDPEPVKILQQGIIKHLKVPLVRPVLIKLRHQPRIHSAPETLFCVIYTVAISVSFL